MKRWLLSALMSALGACAGVSPPPAPEAPPSTAAEIELVESIPVETTLDNADVRDAADVWPEMIARAERSVDVSQFYASDAGGDHARGARLGAVVEALEQAATRGVRVRFLADASFEPKYPATLERLRRAGVVVRTIDCAARYGGVQHAKYFVVDGASSFVGSQNFDWRALDHIHEVGVRVRSADVARALLDVFETDWELADRATAGAARRRTGGIAPEVRARTGEAVSVVASPTGWLPDEGRWELPRLVALLDGAVGSASVQVLVHSTTNRDGSAFPTLDDALRRAAARGVQVRLLISHWGANEGSHARATALALAAIPNIEVRVVTIPAWSGGEIPFARVAHAKYLVVDGRAAWIGTSNWEGDYFLRSRNVAVVAEGGALAGRLTRVFDDVWSSAYAAPLR